MYSRAKFASVNVNELINTDRDDGAKYFVKISIVYRKKIIKARLI